MRIITRVLKRAGRSLRGLGPYLLLVAVLAGLIALGMAYRTPGQNPGQASALERDAIGHFCADRPNVADCRGDVLGSFPYDGKRTLLTIHLHGKVQHPTLGPTTIHGPIVLMVDTATHEILDEAYFAPEREG